MFYCAFCVKLSKPIKLTLDKIPDHSVLELLHAPHDMIQTSTLNPMQMM